MLFGQELGFSSTLISELSFLKSDFKTRTVFVSAVKSVINAGLKHAVRVHHEGLRRREQEGCTYRGVREEYIPRGAPTQGIGRGT